MTLADTAAPTPASLRDREALLRSLRAGVVPRAGQHLIQVGRNDEVRALSRDLEAIANGGSTFRLVLGEYGAGKSFFLNLVEAMARQMKMVTLRADLSPGRRLYSTSGQARALYAELLANAATRTKPDGGATLQIVERFVTSAHTSATETGVTVDEVLSDNLASLEELHGGYDFANVIRAYWRAHEENNPALSAAAVRWLRAEYATKTEARQDLNVRGIITDETYYDHLKVLARFVRLAGYSGLLICVDELVNLYKITNTVSRSANYEQLLRILNDCLQGTAEGIGFIFGATTEMVTDPRRGLYSYRALATRLAENPLLRDGLVDFSGPTLRLASFTPEDVYVLLDRLRALYSDEVTSRAPDEALTSFLAHCHEKVGDAYFRTPRKTIKEFVDLLALIEQNPEVQWDSLISAVEIAPDVNPDLVPLEDEIPVDVSALDQFQL